MSETTRSPPVEPHVSAPTVTGDQIEPAASPETSTDRTVGECDRAGNMRRSETELDPLDLPPDLLAQSRPGHCIGGARQLGIDHAIVEKLPGSAAEVRPAVALPS